MPTYQITDPDSGKTLRLTGESPPTEQELTEIFAQYQQPQQSAQPEPQPEQQAPSVAGEYGPVPTIGETALHMGTGLAGAAVGGLAGLGTLATGGGLEKASQRVQDISQAVTYQPRTKGGQAGTAALMWPVEKATEGWGMLGGMAGEAVGGEQGRLAGEMLGEVGFQSAAVLAGKPWTITSPKGAQIVANIANKQKSFRIGQQIVELQKAEGKLKETVKNRMDKSSTISRTGLTADKKIERAYNSAVEAVKTIVKRKDNLEYSDFAGKTSAGHAPKNLQEFSQSISQLKNQLFKEYDALRLEAEGTGALVSEASIVAELEKLVEQRGVNKYNTTAANYAKKMLREYDNVGQGLTFSETQKVIAVLNERLKAYQANPNPAGASKASIDAMMLNQLRQNMQKAIDEIPAEKFGGKAQEYSKLKKEYGNLTAIEKQVNQRRLRDDQSQGLSTMNFYDVVSAHDVLSGAVTGNPMMVAKGGLIGYMSHLIKKSKDPNRLIEKMFKEAEQSINRIEKLMPEKELERVVADVEQRLLQGPRNPLALPEPPGPGMPMGMGPTEPIPMGRGPVPMNEQLNQLALPAPPAPPQFKAPGPLERMYQIMQSPEGRVLLLDRLGREQHSSRVWAELNKLPTEEAILQAQKPTSRIRSGRETRKARRDKKRNALAKY